VGIAIATLVTAACLAGCGGDEGPGAMRVTMTDSACTYEGDVTLTAGAFTLEVANESSNDGSFVLASMAEGATIDDLEAHAKEVVQQFEQGKGLIEPPAFYSQVVRVGAASGTESQLPADVAAGTYAVTCFQEDPPGTLLALYVATLLEVSE
jgi:hypothetical protein